MRAWIKPGYGLLLLLLLLPLLIAMPRLMNLWDGGAAGALRVFGLVTGILGMAMLLLAAALSIRLPQLDRYFGGLPQLWLVHRGLGFGAFILIMAHALLLGLAAAPASLEATLITLFPPVENWPVWSGWGALILMVVFLGPTFQFFGRPHYQRWKTLHLLAIPTTLLALAHLFPLAGEFWLWLLLALLAVGAMVWRKGLSPHLGRYEYEVVGAEKLVRDVVEVQLKPVGKTMPYKAGQFVYLTPLDSNLSAGRNEEHPYTIASSPEDPVLRIGIKDLGDASHAIQTVTPGTRAWVEGPYGDFYERLFPDRDQLWLAGGIGVTPFVGGARHLRDADELPGHAGREKANAHLFYLGRDHVRAYYLDELLDIGEHHTRLSVTPHYFRDEGPMSEDFLRRHCPDFADREIYMCGPPAMIDHLKTIFQRAGVPGSRIHSEVFDFL